MEVTSILVIILIIFILLSSFFMLFTSSNYNNNNINMNKSIYSDEYKSNLVKAWVDHLMYTRLVVMAALQDDPELNALLTRLMQNQDDIGNIVSTYYGKKARTDITNELHKHINLAVDTVKSVKAGNKADIDSNLKKLYANADDIGAYLDKLLNKQIFRHHMKMHIDTLVANVTSFAKKDGNDIPTLDNYTHSGVDMALAMI